MKCPAYHFRLFFTFLYIGVLFILVLPPGHVLAQAWSIASTYRIEDSNAVDGDIIAITQPQGTFVRATEAEGQQAFGILVDTPVVVMRTDPALRPLVREGDVSVNVSTLAGPINIGDPLKVSPLPGRGQKVTESGGAAFGTALEAFPIGAGTKEMYNGQEVWVGRIHVALKVGNNKSDQIEAAGGIITRVNAVLTSVVNILKNGEDVTRILRYIVAGLVAVVTVYMAFTMFGRNVTKGIEAIGRNPLAKLSIQAMIVVNIILIAVVTIGGVILTLVLIKF